MLDPYVINVVPVFKSGRSSGIAQPLDQSPIRNVVIETTNVENDISIVQYDTRLSGSTSGD